MLNKNYKVLFLLRLLKSILTNFVDVFLVLYLVNENRYCNVFYLFFSYFTLKRPGC